MKKATRVLSLLMVFMMMFTLSVHADNTKDETKLREKIEKEVRSEYAKDPQFQLEIQQNGEEAAEKMINNVVESRVKKALNSNSDFVTTGGNGSIFYVSVPLIKQNNYYYCGPANVLQAIYGFGKASSVSGSTDSLKQTTLGTSMGTTSGVGTYVYKVRDELNKYADYNYVYALGSGMTQSAFSDNLLYSIMYDYAPILHAKTEYLSYYNGYSTGHYITVNYINISSNMVNLQDTNNNSTYYGSHEIPLSEAYDSINATSGRYLIYLPY